MSALIHVAEVALLLAAAYTLGWLLGYAARRLGVRRPEPVVAVIPAERLAAATGQAPPLVQPPVILPLPTGEPTPAAPAEPPPAPDPVPAAPEPAVPSASAATRPGEAWAGEIRGRAAGRFQRTPPAAPAPLDEDAAMRAVEGGSGRSDAQIELETPEISDLGVAVAAAQSAVEQAIARLETDPPPAGDKRKGG